MHFTNLADTDEFHWMGSLVTFNDKLTIIAGWRTVNVRVLENASGEWNVSRIREAPDEFNRRINLHALVIPGSGTETLFIFGKK